MAEWPAMRLHPVLLLLPLAVSTGADGEVRLGCGFGGGMGIEDADGDGYGSTIDCDDADPAIHPQALEYCDGIDNDCDDDIDEDDAVDGSTWYWDGDHDGWGVASGEISTACHQPDGYGPAGDCYDYDPRISPDADEVCDGVDNDCDGQVDADPVDGRTGCLDADGDGFGDPAICETACFLPGYFVENDEDCDDADPAIHPLAVEICDEIDNDCDGLIDPQAGDADGDGWDGCEGDCAWDDPTVHPGALEICDDGIDNDCDGSAGDCGVQGSFSLGQHGLLLTSPQAFDGVGTAVTGAGDLDDDGYDDLAIGAPWYSGVGSDAGAVYIVRGSPALRDESQSTLDSADLVLRGEGDSDALGWSLGPAGDMDGDGLADLIIGAPQDAQLGYEAGAAYLVHGAALAGLEGEWSVGELGHRLGTSGYDDLLGWAVAGLDDVDGDGHRDLLLGAPQADGLAPACGVVYLLRGPVDADRDVADADASWSSDDLDDGLGIAVASAGDMDGDGLRDLAFGAYRRDTTLQDPGVAAVVLGSGDLSGAYNFLAADAQLLGTQAQAFVGSALAGAGDVDADGYDDLLVGARGEDFGLSDTGGVYLIRGPYTGVGYISYVAVASIRGEEAYGYLGSAVAGVGDLDRDFRADIAVAAPYCDGDGGTNQGRAAVFYGPVEGTLSLGDGQAVLEGSAAGQLLGDALSRAGDVDGDGVGDLLVGVPGYDQPSADAGAAWLLWGGLGL